MTYELDSTKTCSCVRVRDCCRHDAQVSLQVSALNKGYQRIQMLMQEQLQSLAFTLNFDLFIFNE